MKCVGALPLCNTFRRSRVFSFLQFCSVASRSQVQEICFSPNLSTDYRTWKCRNELKRMVEAKWIKVGRCSVTSDYVYWIGDKPENMDHAVQVTWVYVTLEKTGKLDVFKRECPCGEDLIADAYFEYEGPYFLEFQRAVNHSNFSEKVAKYEQYSASGKWDDENWPMPGKFARILVVTETDADKNRIQRKVKNSPLNWIVCTLEAFLSDHKNILGINTPAVKEVPLNGQVEAPKKTGWEML